MTLVCVKEVHNKYVSVPTDDNVLAVQMVKDGQGEDILTEYSFTMPSDTWTTEKEGE